MSPVFGIAQNVLKVQSGAQIKTTGGAIITLQDMDLDNDGTINQVPGEGSFKFTGSLNNVISGTSQPLFDILDISKTGSAKLSLNRNINIGSSINFTSGLIDLNTNNIFLQPTALLNGESETSRITGTTGGYVEITNSLNVPSSINPGNLGAIISSFQNLGSTLIRRGHQSQVNGVGAGNSIFRYYDIAPTNNTSLNATLRFSYFDAELNSLAESNLQLWKSPDNINWSNLGFISRDISANYVEKTGIPDFSRWTLSTPGNALPLVWGSFNTKCVNNKVTISWKTLQEFNTSSFIIQGSNNGNDWVTVTTLQAAGQSNNPVDYNYTVQQTVSAFYRIVQIDLDGRKTISPVLRSSCGEKEFFNVYPNPVTQSNVIVAVFANTNDKEVWLRIHDNKGALIKLQKESLHPGMNQLIMNLDVMADGAYNLVINWPDGRMKAIKLIKQ
jgi:hypothetical protein